MLGRRIAQYRIVGRLGVGGMGVVYEAEDHRLSRLVALKFLSEDIAADPEAIRRLNREAQILAQLNHRNICIIYEIAEHDDRPFIVMERADGVNLRTWTATQHVETTAIVTLAIQIAEALEAAHAREIVHRDIKPGNIVVSGSGLVKVLDFGLARSFQPVEPGGPPPPGSTIVGRPVGTTNFMAPERLRQEALDPRSDLFSLGVILYEMATGTLPFAGSSAAQTVENILEDEPVPLRKRAPDRPGALDDIVSQLLEKRAADRYQSASELLAALRRFGAGSRRRSLKQIVRRLLRKKPGRR
jgi:non-specific serine/threonine protein kinase